MAKKDKKRATTPSELETALDRFKLARDTFEAQRQREVEDLKFQVPELQWDEPSAQLRRGGDIINGVTIPARPMLSISKIDQPVKLIVNQMRAAHLGIQIHPVSEDANKDTAEMLQGLYRHIERTSRAQSARKWAFDRAVKCGMGFYRVNTVYDHRSGNPTDQTITIDRIFDQDLVFIDPSATMENFSDIEWGFIATWMPIDKAQRNYPKSRLAKLSDDALRALVQEVPEWVRLDGPKKTAVLVAEYFRKEYRERQWVQLLDGGFGYADELQPGQQVDPMGVTRTVLEPRVIWSVITGTEELTEPAEWNGRYIPIVVVVGNELQPFDSERRWTGVIRNARDGQRLYNYAASNSVEIAANEPRAPWLMYEGQDENYEEMWQQANVRNFPVLKVRRTTIGGQPAPLPQRVPIDGSRLGVSMELLQQANQYIQETTATFDPSLGNANARDRSGRAVLALQQQADAATGDYLDNLATVSMQYEAEMVLDLIPKVFDRPGRVVQIVSGEDEQTQVMLNRPFQMVNGRAVAAQGALPQGDVPRGPGAPWGMPAGATMPQPQSPVKHFDLQRGVYGVAVSVGKSFQTRLEEGSAEIGQILQADPALMPIIGPTYFKFRDFPGSQEIADLLKKMRAKQFPGLDDGDGADPQAQLQQMQAQLQQAQEQLQQANQYIAKEQAKVEGQVAIEREKGQLQIELQGMKNAATIEVAKINAIVKGVLLDGQAENEAQALASQQDADRAAQHQEHAHDVGMAHLSHILAQVQQAQAQQHEASQADLDRAQQASLAQPLQGDTPDDQTQPPAGEE